MASDALEKFRRSMAIGYMEWHDGIGYDLDALDALPPEDRQTAEDWLVARRAADWRDIEALDRLGSPRALRELMEALGVKSIDVRIEAARRLADRALLSDTEIETIIVDALAQTKIIDGMVKTLSFAAAHPTAGVRAKLLYSALHGKNHIRVHAAALVHFLYGGSASHFDMNFRSFYLRFGAKDREERRAAYLELCKQIGVEPEESR